MLLDANGYLQKPIYNRATRSHPPPPLQRDQRKLTYGMGVPAVWNSAPEEKGKEKAKPIKKDPESNSENGNGIKLVDALMYATWDWDVKDFRATLGPRKGLKPTFGKSSSRHDKERDKARDREREQIAEKDRDRESMDIVS